MVKITSIKRILSQMIHFSENELLLLQNAYHAKNPSLARQILKKPNLSDSSSLAQARLSTQYINFLVKPQKNGILLAKREYNANLISTNDLRVNFLHNFNELHKKTKKPITLFPYQPFSSTQTINSLACESDQKILYSFWYSYVDSFNSQIIREIKKFNSKSKKILQIRVTVQYYSSDNSLRYYSTKKCKIIDIKSNIAQMLKNMDGLDFTDWNRISPTNEDFLLDLQTNQIKIEYITYCKYEYFF